MKPVLILENECFSYIMDRNLSQRLHLKQRSSTSGLEESEAENRVGRMEGLGGPFRVNLKSSDDGTEPLSPRADQPLIQDAPVRRGSLEEAGPLGRGQFLGSTCPPRLRKQGR